MATSEVEPSFEPPFSVHLLWDEGPAGPMLAERLFHFLSHEAPPEPGQGGGFSPAPTLRVGAGMPVYAGSHHERVEALLAAGARVAIVLCGEQAAERYQRFKESRRAGARYGVDWICLGAFGTDPTAITVTDLGRPEADGRTGLVEVEVGLHIGALLRGGEPVVRRITVFVPEVSERPAPIPDVGAHLEIVRTVPGNSLELHEPLRARAVCLVVRQVGGGGAWIETETLAAKKLQIPILEVVPSPSGDLRTFPYGGNVRALSSADDVSLACLQAWIQHHWFKTAGPAYVCRRNLPDEIGAPVFLTRSPELVDLAQGPLTLGDVHIVLYPDPPLPAAESALLRRANPRARFVTPSTFGDNVLQREPGPPLAGLEIALSLSHSPDVPATFAEISPNFLSSRQDGTTRLHANAAIAYLSLSLVRFGARLAYGGHLREDGYTKLLDDIVQSHNRDRVAGEAALKTYVAAHLFHTNSPIQAEKVRVPDKGDPAADDIGKAVELAQMRLAMARTSDARVILGGKRFPRRFEEDEAGYSGRLPGQVEEALYHLRDEKPLYVAGGFHGAAGLVAQVLAEQDEALPTETSLSNNEYYRQFASKFDAISARVPDQPRSLDALWDAFRELRSDFWRTDADGFCPNGLTVMENRVLFRSTEHDVIASLVVRGLMRVARRRAAKPTTPLRVLAFNGPLGDTLDVESYGVMTLPGRRLSRAEEQLDTRMKGALRDRLRSKRPSRILAIGSRAERLSGSWVIPAEVKADAAPADQVRDGVEVLRNRAQVHGIGSIAVGLFGNRLGLSTGDAVRAQVDAFLARRGEHPRSVVFCEDDPQAFQEMVQVLESYGNHIQLVVLEERIVQPPAETLPVTVYLDGERGPLAQFVRGAGVRGGIPLEHRDPAGWQALAAELDDVERTKGLPPKRNDHPSVGLRLAEVVLAHAVRHGLTEHLANRRVWDFVLDHVAADIPLELLAWPGETPDAAPTFPALTRVFRRALLVEGMTPPVPRSKAGPLRMLLIANPTGDLKSTETEARRVVDILNQHRRRIDVTALLGPRQADAAAVLERLDEPFDLIHYAGHGTTDPRRPEGLVLRQRTWRRSTERILTTADLSEKFKIPPLFVFFNACYAARVRRPQITRPAPIAQAVLAGGTHAFVGNRWAVDDSDAADFAITMYRRWVLDGDSLGQAILRGREHLFAMGSRDWANFQLYGADDLRLD